MPAKQCRQGQPRKPLRTPRAPLPRVAQAPPPGPALTCVGQEAVALVPSHVVDTRALVQTRVGRTLVDVGLAVGAWRGRDSSQCGRHPGCCGQVPPGVEEGPCAEPGAWTQPQQVCTPAPTPHPGREPPRVAVAGPVSWLRAAALGGPLCTRSPAPLTTEAFPARTHVAAGHVPAGAAVDTGVRLTLVAVDVTVRPTPPGVTVTLVPAEVTTQQLRCGPRGEGLGWGHSPLCHLPMI